MYSNIIHTEWVSIAGISGLAVVLGFFFWNLHRRALSGKETQLAASILLIVNNQAEIIEGFVRQLCALVAQSKKWLLDINIVDENSSDETAAILERLWFYFPIKVACWRRLSGISAFEIGRFLCDQPFIWVLYLNGEEDGMAYLSAIKCLINGHDPNERTHLREVRL